MRQRLLLLVIAALLPLVVVIGALSFHSVSQKRASMREAAIGYAADVLRSVDREIRAQSRMVDILSRSPTLEGAPLQLDAFHEVASRFIAQVQGWDRVVLAQKSRGQVLNTGVPAGEPRPGIIDLGGFDRALAQKEVGVTNLTGPGPKSPHGRPVIALRKRLDLADAEPYVLSVLIRTEVFDRATAEARIEPTWRPFLIDGTNRIISAPRAAQSTGQRAGQAAIEARAAGNSGIYAGVAADGTPVITTFIKSPDTGWSAHVSIPTAEYNEPLRQSIIIIGALTLLGLALFGLFIFLARRELLSMNAEAEALSRASRMEALGRITGGVSHDFNNLLMVITTGAEMLRKRNPDKGAERFLNAIQSAAERGSRLTRQLLTFARGQGGEVATIDIGLRLTSIKSLLQQTASEKVELAFDIPEGPHFIRVDPIQFDLSIINVVANARDAMPAGGRATIALERADYPDQSGRRGLRLSITDTGSGIQPADLPHVFEPFYTTRKVGEGSGLGLSHVYGFAKAHDGLADIASEPDAGTIVSIYLPEASVPDEQPAEEKPAIDETWRADGLQAVVVDDNDDVRILTGEVLADIGFKVRYASNASEGLALCEAGADLLVSDIVMPGAMNGVELGRMIRQRWPDMQTILMTGYSEASSEAAAAGLRVIRKPFTRATLLAAISTSRFDGSRRRRSTV